MMSEVWLNRYIFAIVSSFVICVVLMPPAIRLLNRFQLVDLPNERKVHKTPVPRLGGVPMYIAFVAPMAMIFLFDTPQKGIIIGSGIALVIGVCDDIWGVPALVKLFALFGLTLLLAHYGVLSTLPFEQLGLDSHWGNIAVTMLWIVGVCSAMNALDHMDGLAGGVALIAAIAYLTVALTSGQMFFGLLAICLIGSLAGFLMFNHHPARIFMGDGGSFFLGFTLAATGVMGGWSPNPLKGAIIPVAILSVPLFDLAYVIIARRLDGTVTSIRGAIAYCGKDHIGHRFTAAGLGQIGAVRLVHLIAVTVAISALTIRNTDAFESMMLLLQIMLIYLIIVVYFRARQPEKSRRRRAKPLDG